MRPAPPRPRIAALIVGVLVVLLALPREAHVSGPGSLSVLSRHYRLAVSHGPSIAWGADGPGDYYARVQRELAVRYAGLVADLDGALARAAKAERLALAAVGHAAIEVDGEDVGRVSAAELAPRDREVDLVVRPSGETAMGDGVVVTVALARLPTARDVAWLRAELGRLVRAMPALEVANLDDAAPLVRRPGSDDWAPIPLARRLVLPTPRTFGVARAAVELRPYHALDPAAFGAPIDRLERELPAALDAELAALERDGVARFVAVASPDVGAPGGSLVVSDEQPAGLVTATVRAAGPLAEAARDAVRTRLARVLRDHGRLL